MVNPSPSTPRLSELIQIGVDEAQFAVRTIVLARVEKWDPDEQAINAQPLIKRVRIVDGVSVAADYPVINRVPVSFLRWGGFVIRCGLKVGDVVTLLVSDRELERWTAGGSPEDKPEQVGPDPIEPRSGRLHALDDAVAYPGFSPWGKPISGLEDGELVIGREDGSGELRIKTDGSIELGSQSAGKKGVARLDDETTSDTTTDPELWAWVLALHVLVQTPSPPGGPHGGLPAYLTLFANPPQAQKGKITSASSKASTE